MKRLFLIVLTVVTSLLFFVGCDDGSSSSSDPVNMLPSLGGSVSRATIGSSVNRATLLYYLQTPMLYSFEDNNQGVGAGDSFTASNDVFGNITFKISQSGSVVTYVGTNADNTVEMTITYNQDTRVFSLNQFMYIDDSNKILSGGANAMKLFAQVNVSDITIASDGTFQGDTWAVVMADMGSGLGSQVNGVGELYHGEMTAGNTGTGVAFHDQGNGTLPDLVGKPATTAALANFNDMKSYMTSVGYAGFKAGVTMNELNGIYYRIGQATAVECDGNDEHSAADGDGNATYHDNDINTTTDFIAYFNEKGLTSWATKTKFK